MGAKKKKCFFLWLERENSKQNEELVDGMITNGTRWNMTSNKKKEEGGLKDKKRQKVSNFRHGPSACQGRKMKERRSEMKK